MTSTQAQVLPDQTITNTPIVVEAAADQVLSAETISIEDISDKNINVEKYVRAYYAKTPILAEIARCESRFTQFTKNGNVLRGRITPDDVGVMQINEYYHGAEAIKLGYDIHSLDGNLAFAKLLYDNQGVRPWSASAGCWNK